MLLSNLSSIGKHSATNWLAFCQKENISLSANLPLPAGACRPGLRDVDVGLREAHVGDPPRGGGVDLAARGFGQFVGQFDTFCDNKFLVIVEALAFTIMTGVNKKKLFWVPSVELQSRTIHNVLKVKGAIICGVT